MKRDVERMTRDEFDLAVVGGGIYGVCAAWEAALRGLKVALVERGDFGGATSSNSLRTLHGGLRYLQHLDVRRMRESIRERRSWLQLAPELTQPQRFVMPTRGSGLQGPTVFRAALALNDLIGMDRNQGIPQSRHLPAGGVLNRAQACSLFAESGVTDFNGAAYWYDAICLNSERLLIEVAHAAAKLGAQLANYVEATGLETSGGRVRAVRVRDTLTGIEHQVRTRTVIDAAGPWVGQWTGLGSATQPPLFRSSKAFNLLTRRVPFDGAVGLPVPRVMRDTDALLNRGANTYFVMPWKEWSLIGTRHLRCVTGESTAVTADEVRTFVQELNPLLGRHALKADDIRWVYSGVLPEREGNTGSEVVLEKHGAIVDYARRAGPSGCIALVGVKWTTARLVAQEAVEKLCCSGLITGKSKSGVRQLSSTATEVLNIASAEPSLAARLVPDNSTNGAQIVFAARAEMAIDLEDVVFRRTDLYLSRALDIATLRRVSALIGREAGPLASAVESQVGRTLARLESMGTVRQ